MVYVFVICYVNVFPVRLSDNFLNKKVIHGFDVVLSEIFIYSSNLNTKFKAQLTDLISQILNILKIY